MIGLDTNVLVRYVVADDPGQSQRAARFIESRCTKDDPGFVDRVALCEMVWVLTRGYGYERDDIVRVVEALLASTDIVLEDHQSVRQALHAFETDAVGFADALIGLVNRERGCDATATFDRRAARFDAFIAVP
jgi:predicted nucleic-acid-binding protein